MSGPITTSCTAFTAAALLLAALAAPQTAAAQDYSYDSPYEQNQRKILRAWEEHDRQQRNNQDYPEAAPTDMLGELIGGIAALGIICLVTGVCNAGGTASGKTWP